MKQKKITAFSVIVFIVLALFSLTLLFLLVWGAMASVKEQFFDFRVNVLGFPKELYFENYLTVWKHIEEVVQFSYAELIFNTLVICLIASVGGTFFPCLIGYLVAKYPCKFSSVFYWVALIAMSLPIIGAFPSELNMLRTLGIYNTFFSPVFQKTTYLGLYFFVFSAVFKGISNDFYDAASIDGATDFGIFFKIMLPMVLSTLGTVFLLTFVAHWNDYQYALMYIPEKPTLSYGTYLLSIATLQDLNNTPVKMAACFMLILPVLIIFIIFKEKMMSNLSMGGLKE